MNEVKGGLVTDKDEIELSKLMRQAQSGDALSYRQALSRMHEMLTVYIRNSLRKFHLFSDEVKEDLVQEALLIIHQKRETYDPAHFFLPWMYAIARYKVIDYLRRHRVSSRSVVAWSDELENIEAVIRLDSMTEAGADIERLTLSLSDKQREILNLVKLQELSIEEVSQRTGYSASDIKVTVHRAIKILQEKVKEVSND